MPTVTLIMPASLNAFGRLWKRGEPVPMSIPDATKLRSNPRFKVTGLPGQQSEDGKGKVRPANKNSLLNQIRTAISKLDADDADAWLPDGTPNRYALTAITGFEVTAADLREIMVTMPSEQPDDDLSDLDDEDEDEDDTGGDDGDDVEAAKPKPKPKPKPKDKAPAKPADKVRGVVIRKAKPLGEPLDTGADRVAVDAPEEPSVEV